ncbi:hypothetical protein [Streptomyces sp. NPDC059063]|uniref:hypothetical protein n=1 Tax=unclassified Streptomyces TaxID=2593676 RepID=UPI003688FA62
MHRIRVALVAAAMTLTAGTLLTGPAQAAPDDVRGPNCDALWRAHQNDGNVWAYRDLDCHVELGHTPGNDFNWADGSGALTGSDNDAATSLLNTGQAGVSSVQFYEHAGPAGGTGCVSRGELYVDNLTDNVFNNGVGANDTISAHRWSSGCVNPWT